MSSKVIDAKNFSGFMLESSTGDDYGAITLPSSLYGENTTGMRKKTWLHKLYVRLQFIIMGNNPCC